MLNETSRPTGPRGRPFRAVDAMILIAAVGLGVAASCEIEGRFLELNSWTV